MALTLLNSLGKSMDYSSTFYLSLDNERHFDKSHILPCILETEVFEKKLFESKSPEFFR